MGGSARATRRKVAGEGFKVLRSSNARFRAFVGIILAFWGSAVYLLRMAPGHGSYQARKRRTKLAVFGFAASCAGVAFFAAEFLRAHLQDVTYVGQSLSSTLSVQPSMEYPRWSHGKAHRPRGHSFASLLPTAINATATDEPRGDAVTAPRDAPAATTERVVAQQRHQWHDALQSRPEQSTSAQQRATGRATSASEARGTKRRDVPSPPSKKIADRRGDARNAAAKRIAVSRAAQDEHVKAWSCLPL